MANTKLEAEKEVYELMQEVLRAYHPDLLAVMDEIAIVVREKAPKSENSKVFGKASKASDMFGVLTPRPLAFVLEIAGDQWPGLSNRDRKALFDSLLLACAAEDDPETGGTVCSIRKPEVSYFFEELDRWGDWKRPENSEQTLADIFGKGNQTVSGSIPQDEDATPSDPDPLDDNLNS